MATQRVFKQTDAQKLLETEQAKGLFENVIGTTREQAEHAEQAKKEKGIIDFDNFDKSSHKHAIVAMGTTGTGKSSIVQLFCGEVCVSQDTTSATKHAQLFDEVGDNALANRKWMDTQGTDDSDMDDADEKILEGILKKLRVKRIHFITVLWLISGDFDRQKGEYLRQAKFIQSLQTPASPSNVWKSVLIVQKMGQLQPKPSKIRGIIDAAKANGAKMAYRDDDAVAGHVVGFKCIELINFKGGDEIYEALVEAETPQEKLEQLGYITKMKMKTIIAERLNKLDCFMLSHHPQLEPSNLITTPAVRKSVSEQAQQSEFKKALQESSGLSRKASSAVKCALTPHLKSR